TWSLNELGSYLTDWIQEQYHRSDKQLILDAAAIDWAYNRSFVSKEYAHLKAEQLKETDFSPLLSVKLYLQPHVHLFALDYDIFDFRLEFLKQTPEYWIENDFPNLEKGKQWFALFRNLRQDIVYEKIS